MDWPIHEYLAARNYVITPLVAHITLTRGVRFTEMYIYIFLLDALEPASNRNGPSF